LWLPVLPQLAFPSLHPYEAKKSAMDAQTKSMTRVIEVAPNEVFAELNTITRELARLVAKNSDVKRLSKIAQKNSLDVDQKSLLTTELSNEYSRRYVTSGLVDLVKVRTYDKRLNYVASSNAGMKKFSTQLPKTLLNKASPRKGGERLKSLSMLWHSGNITYFHPLPYWRAYFIRLCRNCY